MISITAKKTLTALALLFTLSTPVIGTQTDEQKPPSDSSPTPVESVVVAKPDNSELEALRLELEKIKAEKEQLLKAQEESRVQKEAELKELRERSTQLEQEKQQIQKEKEESVTGLEQLRQEAEKQKELLVQEKEELKTDLAKVREELELSSKEKEEQLVQIRKEKEEALGVKGSLESELEGLRKTLSLYQEAFAPQVGSLLERVRDLNPDPFKVETLVSDCTHTDTLSKEAGELMETLREISTKYEKSISCLSPVFPVLEKHKDGDRAAILLYLKAARETLDNDTERLSRSVRNLRHLHNLTNVTPSDHTTKLLIALAGLDAILKSELQLSESQAKEQIASFLKMIGYIK